MTYRRLGFNEGEVRAFGFPESDEVFCRGARGYLRAAVELLTGGPVELREGMCQCRRQPSCLYRLSWPPTGADTRLASSRQDRRRRTTLHVVPPSAGSPAL